MSRVRGWLARVLGTFAPERRERELAEELESHLRMEVEEQLRQGVSSSEARRRALVRSGGIEAAKEAYRDQRGMPWIDHLGRDLRFAWRTIRRSPAFAAVAVFSLALGIGANVAIFSLTDAVFLRALPVASPGELVLFEWTGAPRTSGYAGSMRGAAKPGDVIGASFSYPFFERIRQAGSLLSGVFAFARIEQLNVVDGAQAGIARGQLVTGEYHETLGVRALHGRTITVEDDRPGVEPVAVLAFDYWRRRFGGDPSVVGTSVMMNGTATTIIGITPPEFRGTLDIGESPDITLPMSLLASIRRDSGDDLTDEEFWWVQIMGRRAAGVTAQQVQAQLEPVFRGAVLETSTASTPLQRGTLERVQPPGLRLVPGSRGPSDERRDYRLPALLLTSIALLILLIACANVANLLLTRATARRHEVTMRFALGASRGRVFAQLLLESCVLVLIAEALGLAFAAWGKDLLLVLRPSTADLRLALDARSLAVATSVGLATVLLTGLVPAFYGTRPDIAGRLQLVSRNTHGRSGVPFGRILVAVQIALSVVLLVGAALFLRTMHNLRSLDVGFDQDRLLLFRVDPRLNGYADERIPDLYRDLQQQLLAIPQVLGVTFSRHALLTGGRRTSRVTLVGEPDTDQTRVLTNLVGADFFQTMQIPIIAGRPFSARDDERAPHVAIIDETFARVRFRDRNPLGHRLRINGTEAEIVGVAAVVKVYSLRQSAEPALYVSFPQFERGQAAFAVRTASNPLALVPFVREAVRRVDPALPIFDVATQHAAVAATLGEERLLASMTTAFGVLALVLACIGVYGVVSYATAQRTGEIGLRIALGAGAPSILWLVARRTVAPTALGIVAGLVAAVLGARLFTRLLYGLAPTDPLSIAGAAALIAAVSLLAASIPATRARRISPLIALRSE